MKSLKMNSLSKNALEAREMRNLVGAGPACGGGCKGPSSTQDNGSANAAGGKHSLCPIEEQEVFINLPEVTIYG